jgi:hypothetical protein
VVYAASRSGVLVLATTNDSATSPRPLGTLPRPRTAYQASLDIFILVSINSSFRDLGRSGLRAGDPKWQDGRYSGTPPRVKSRYRSSLSESSVPRSSGCSPWRRVGRDRFGGSSRSTSARRGSGPI